MNRRRIDDLTTAIRMSLTQLERRIDAGFDRPQQHASALVDLASGLAYAAVQIGALQSVEEHAYTLAQLTSARERIDRTLEELQSRRVVAGETTATPFDVLFSAAFDRLRGDRGLNLVALADLRAALPSFDRASFDRELYALRVADRFVLHTFDGRHGKLRPEDEAATIVEDGRRFVFAARREST